MKNINSVITIKRNPCCREIQCLPYAEFLNKKIGSISAKIWVERENWESSTGALINEANIL